MALLSPSMTHQNVQSFDSQRTDFNSWGIVNLQVFVDLKEFPGWHLIPVCIIHFLTVIADMPDIKQAAESHLHKSEEWYVTPEEPVLEIGVRDDESFGRIDRALDVVDYELGVDKEQC